MGRVPVVVSFDELDKDALVRILTEPKNAIIKQYQGLIGLDDVELTFTPEAIEAIAERRSSAVPERGDCVRSWKASCRS